MRIVKYFLIVILPIVIILGNFLYLIFNFDFYQSLYKEVGVYRSFATLEAVDEATGNLLGYYRGKNELDHNFFSNQAILHLNDVRKSLVFTSNLFYLSFALVLVVIAILIKAKQFRLLIQAAQVASLATIIFMILALLGLFSAFDSLFGQFHQLLFVNNLWLFPKDDNLVKLFPREFFVEFANKLAQNIVVVSVLIALVSFVTSKRMFK